MSINVRRERFLKIATKRTNKVLEDIAMLSNCANTNNYEYTEEEVKKMFFAIETELNNAKSKFNIKKKERFNF